MAEPSAPDASTPPTDDATRGQERDKDNGAHDPFDPRLLRALADLDNIRKRSERQLASAAADERARVVTLWLPVVDNLERALQHADAHEPAGLIEGIRAVYEQMLDVLARLGVLRFEDVGEPFDPARHEAVGAMEVEDAAPATIIAAVRPGYANEGSVLRPADVMVARGPG